MEDKKMLNEEELEKVNGGTPELHIKSGGAFGPNIQAKKAYEKLTNATPDDVILNTEFLVDNPIGIDMNFFDDSDNN